MNPPCDLVILAGEMSGDLHGSLLIQELKKIKPEIQIHAVAGPRMRAQGVSLIGRMEDLEVMGFFDVLAAAPKLFSLFHKFKKKILELKPQACLFIDYPEFHIRLARSLRKSGFQGKLLHFICPTVWAWGKGRIKIMSENLDLLLTLFPFEPDCFKHTQLKAKYVGHPLTEAVANHTYQPNEKKEKILALFPGSRRIEIERNLPLQAKAALALLQPGLKIALSLAKKEEEAFLRNEAERAGLKEYTLVFPDKHYDLMKNAQLALATSGTVTLELALHETPTVVTYAIRRRDQFFAQKILRIDLPYYCIVNILLQKEIFPELFGSHLTFDRLFCEAKKFLTDESAAARCRKGCQEVKESLQSLRPSFEAANAILAMMGNLPQ